MRPRWGFLYFKNRKLSNILQIKYQMLVLVHMEYEAMMDCIPFTNRSLAIFYSATPADDIF